MSRSDDDQGMKPLDERTADRLLSGRPVADEAGLTAFVQQVQAFAPLSAPEPSGALAELLAGGLPVAAPAPVATARAGRWSAVSWRRAAVAGLSLTGVVLAAGAANALPAPAQEVVADVVGWVTPVDLPRPDDDDGAEPLPVPTPSPSLAPGADDDAPAPTRAPVPSASADDDRDDDSSGRSPRPSQTPDDDEDSGSDEPDDDPDDQPSEDPDEESDEPSPEPSDSADDSSDAAGSDVSGSDVSGSSGSGDGADVLDDATVDSSDG